MRKHLMLSIYLSIFFTLICQSVALASPLTCAKVFEARKSTELSQPSGTAKSAQAILDKYSELSKRVLQVQKESSPQASLYVALTPNERAAMTKTISRSLRAAHRILEHLKKDNRNQEPDFKKFLNLMSGRLKVIDEQLAEFKDHGIYKHAIEISNESQLALMHLNDAISSHYVHVFIHAIEGSSEFRLGNDQHLEWQMYRALENENIVVPSELSLSVDDFLVLAGSGVAPAGMVLKPTPADQGTIFSPYTYFDHDFSHASAMTRPFNPHQRKYWNSLLNRIALKDARTEGLMKSILFYLTHERPEYGRNVLNISAAEVRLGQPAFNRGTSVYEFILKDDFFGIDSLQGKPPSEAEFERAKSELLRVMREVLNSI